MTLPSRVTRNVPAARTFEFAQRDFDHLLNRLFNGHDAGGDAPARLAPYAVDVREDEDHIYVEAELPGFKKDNVDITLENQTLTISAERRDENKEGDEKKGELLLHERRHSRFLRSFKLPPTVNEQSVNAKLLDGVLTVTLNKREESKPRKISVA